MWNDPQSNIRIHRGTLYYVGFHRKTLTRQYSSKEMPPNVAIYDIWHNFKVAQESLNNKLATFSTSKHYSMKHIEFNFN